MEEFPLQCNGFHVSGMWGHSTISSPAQWVMDPALPQLGHRSGLIPDTGTSYAVGWPKKKKKLVDGLLAIRNNALMDICVVISIG